jgi:hypothetical protein
MKFTERSPSKKSRISVWPDEIWKILGDKPLELWREKDFDIAARRGISGIYVHKQKFSETF